MLLLSVDSLSGWVLKLIYKLFLYTLSVFISVKKKGRRLLQRDYLCHRHKNIIIYSLFGLVHVNMSEMSQ